MGRDWVLVERVLREVGWWGLVEVEFVNLLDLGLVVFSPARIFLSDLWLPFLSEEEFVDTLLHEVAHLNVGHGRHDGEWREEVVRLGGRPRAVAPVDVRGFRLRYGRVVRVCSVCFDFEYLFRFPSRRRWCCGVVCDYVDVSSGFEPSLVRVADLLK